MGPGRRLGSVLVGATIALAAGVLALGERPALVRAHPRRAPEPAGMPSLSLPEALGSGSAAEPLATHEGVRATVVQPGTLTVRVVHGVSGAPLERAFVDLWQDADRREIRRAEVADADGLVRLRGFAPDRPCEIQARHPGHVGRVVEWGPGSASELEIRLAPLGVVRGTLLAGSEDERALASVWLLRDTGERVPGGLEPDGSFEFVHVPYGVPLHLSADVPGGSAVRGPVFVLPPERSLHVEDLHLEAAGEVRVAWRAGARPEHAWISVQPVDRSDPYREGPAPIGRPDAATGEEVFRLPEPGRYAVTARCLDWISEPVLVDVSRGRCARIEIGPVPSARPVAGLLLDALGAPLPGRSIGIASGSGFVGTDARGRFELRVIGPGPFDLHVGAAPPATGVEAVLRGLELEGPDVVVRLPIPAALRWRLVPPWSVDELRWAARCGDADAQGTVRGREGVFEVTLGLLGGGVSFRVGGGNEPSLLELDGLDLRAGDVLELGVIDVRERDLAGVVLDPEGRPLQDVHVQGIRHGQPGPWDTTSDSRGRFVLEGAPAATGVSLRASDGDLLRSVDVPITSWTGEARLRLSHRPRVVGRVVSRSGALLGRAIVEARDEVGSPSVRVRTSPGGTFSLVLDPGRHRLEARPFGGESVPGPVVEVTWEEVLEIELGVP